MSCSRTLQGNLFWKGGKLCELLQSSILAGRANAGKCPLSGQHAPMTAVGISRPLRMAGKGLLATGRQNDFGRSLLARFRRLRMFAKRPIHT